jgi:hypothetical protein
MDVVEGVDVIEGEDEAVVGDPVRRPLFGARGFLAFGAPSSAILFGGMVVEEKRSCNCGGFRREKWYMRCILEGNKINGEELPFLWPTPRARSMFRVFLFRPESPSAPLKAGNGLGSPDG